MNSLAPTCEARRLPSRPVNEDKLNIFLVKACSYAGIEDAVMEIFDNIMRVDSIPVKMDVSTEPESLVDYMEGWRMKLSDQVYMGVFRRADTFKKSNSFRDYTGSDLLVKVFI